MTETYRVPLCKPPKAMRPKCGARCRDGHACQARVVWDRFEGSRKRCRMHGGLSTGPKTPEGRACALEAAARGRETITRNRLARRMALAAGTPEPGG